MPRSPAEALKRLNKYPEKILGTAELCEVLGISKQALSNRVSRSRPPVPKNILAMGPLWTKSAVVAYLKSPRDRV